MKPVICNTGQSLTVSHRGQVYTIPVSDPRHAALLLALEEKRYEDIPNICDYRQLINSKSKGIFYVKDDVVYLVGEDNPLPKGLSKKIVAFSKEGLDYQYLINFWNRVQDNPSATSIAELFDCLDRNHHPITPEGYFLAYKAVAVGRDGNLWDIISLSSL